MSYKQPTVIPLDVYGLIIDSLAEDDEELTTMRACSLVSRVFLHLSRKHILATVKINSPLRVGTSSSIDKFVHLIERNPEIGEYVRKFNYCIATHNHIPRTLGKLTRLKSLSIWHHTENKLVWTTNWPMRSALLHLMQLPTLSYLELRWITNFPVSDLIHSSSLKHLEIDYIDFAAEDVVPPSTTPLPSKSVCLREYSAGLRSASATKKLIEAKRSDGLPIVDFTELTKVTASWDNQEDVNVIQPIFIQAKQLKEIDLTITSESLTYAGLAEMVIRSIRTLKALKLGAFIDDSSEDPLSGLCDELEKISTTGRSIIETLSIDVAVQTDADCKRGDEWGLLDKVLTKQDAWLGLKEVSLKIEVYDYCRGDDDDLVAALNKLPDTQFKNLSTSETINFIFKVTEEWV